MVRTSTWETVCLDSCFATSIVNRVLSEMGEPGKWGEIIYIGRKDLDVSVTGSKEALVGPGFVSNGL